MKPLHIVVLLAAGAIGGAVIVMVALRPPTVEPATMVAQAQTPPATAPVTGSGEPALKPADAGATGVPGQGVRLETPKPQREAPKPGHAQRTTASKPDNPPTAQSQPAEPEPTALPAPVLAAPDPIPPARIPPENVTPPPPPAPPEPHRVTLNAGTIIPVRLVDGLSTERSLPGDSFTATLDKELVVDGFVIAERGARVEGRVVASDRGGRVKSLAKLEVELVRLRMSDGQTVALQTDGLERRAEDTHRQDAEKVGAGAALGAVIGAIAGGGKGAAIGAGVGGGAGAGTVMATRGNAAALPSETRVTFRLKAPVTATEKLRG